MRKLLYGLIPVLAAAAAGWLIVLDRQGPPGVGPLGRSQARRSLSQRSAQLEPAHGGGASVWNPDRRQSSDARR